jgi:lipoprotein-anchoring transpeptidase ErfK/SrfK
MLSGPAPRSRRLLAWLISLSPLACSGGCEKSPDAPGGTPGVTSPGSTENVAPTASAPTLESPSDHRLGADAGVERAPAPDGGAPAQAWPGPFLTVTSSSAGIYVKPSLDRSFKIGYARSGGRLPVLAELVSGEGCRGGYYELVGGGYICSREGTVDANDPLARLAVQPPDLSAILPYPYARNAHNGTPLYSSVPSKDQMAAYEPHLEQEEATKRGQRLTEGVDAGSRPWWQREQAALSEVRLAELATESDGVLGRRMVKGFYVAVDKEFEWSSRTWYKTTKGMVAPKDRFVPVEGAEFKGVELMEPLTLPVAWAYGFRQTRPKYQLSANGKLTPAGQIQRLEATYLTDEEMEAEGRRYVQTRDGSWLRAEDIRIARMPPIPMNIAVGERWIYIDLRAQTLVALVGGTPAYATLISSGRESDDEAKDHRTPPGEWNIREKHITTTMDGDGTAAGDLPYSIEDVPYVMYFQGSYALHGAFWHRNYGVRMSHGCINLAPLDAKYLFFFTGPSVREGWHGAWAGNGQAGSRIVIEGPARGSPAGR